MIAQPLPWSCAVSASRPNRACFIRAAADVFFEKSIGTSACIYLEFWNAQGRLIQSYRQCCDPREPNIDQGTYAVKSVINGREWHHIMVQAHAPRARPL